VQLAHGTLHVALRDAEREGLLARNVASLVTAPRRSTEEQHHLGPEAARELLLAAKGEPLEAFFTVALTTGLRLGELQGLQWKDINLERQRLAVNRTLLGMRDGQPVFSPSSARKNHSRTVWLTDAAIETLERRQADQDTQRRRAGPAWRECGLVFSTLVGTPLDGNNIRKRSFKRLLEKAGLPTMRFHDLRHSAASLLLAEGVPVKVVSEMLGHADVSTTLRIYAHVIEGAQAQAVSVMDRLFHG
jgi:integrase